MYFSFDFGWYYFHINIFVRTGGGAFGLTEKSIKGDETYLSIVPNFGPQKLI